MKIKYWGVRGSIPAPLTTPEVEEKIFEAFKKAKPKDIKNDQTIWNHIKSLPLHIRGTYGGNTTCYEIRTAENNLIIVDAGSGIRPFGLELLIQKFPEKEAVLLLTHTHWDHIQGWPFFVPAYLVSNEFTIYGKRKVDRGLEFTLSGQMEHHYFPVELRDMQSEIQFSEKQEETFKVYDATITAKELNHPHPGVYGYRITSGGKTIAIATDTEHYQDDPKTGSILDKKVLRLAKNTDLLIYDAQYTPEEEKSKIGWGHSTWKKAAEMAQAAQVNELHLVHHDPAHNDKLLAEIEKKARREFKKTFVAYEGLERTL